MVASTPLPHRMTGTPLRIVDQVNCVHRRYHRCPIVDSPYSPVPSCPASAKDPLFGESLVLMVLEKMLEKTSYSHLPAHCRAHCSLKQTFWQSGEVSSCTLA